MEKIAVTGSSGKIGRSLHWRLYKNYKIIGLDITPSSATSRIVDIREYDKLLSSFEGVNIVFHSAALHAPHIGIASEKDFYDINVKATENICKAAIECGVSQIIFTSTTALYGYANYGHEDAVWVNEQTIPKPKTIYHKTKLEAESILQEYACEQLKVSVMRMSRCFPEPAEIMAIYRLHRGIDYRDVAEAHLLAAQLKKNKHFDIYIISGDTPFLKSDSQMLFQNPEIVIRERYQNLAREFDKRCWKFPKTIDRVYDSSYAQQVLNWKPKRDSFEVINQYDNSDFEVLPPLLI